MEYSEIGKKMIHSSFESKMLSAFSMSRETMAIEGQIPIEKMRKHWLPDEIETFVIFAICSQEWKNDSIDLKTTNRIMDSIRKYMPPALKACIGTDFGDWFVMACGANQFEGQEYSIFRLFRYWFYFNYSNDQVDVRKAFIDKFSFSYDEYLSVVWLLWSMACTSNVNLLFDILRKVSTTFPEILKTLTLTRTEYQNELLQFADASSDYRYCLRPSYSYPFIEDNSIVYLPTPHLLLQSITSAMLNRLTYGNNDLREKIGKNVAEDYLLLLLKTSGIFEDVIKEQEVPVAHNTIRTLDAMTSKDEYRVLFDSKLFVPKTDLRKFSADAREAEIKRIAKHCYQVYEQTRKRFGKDYNFFSNKGINWDKVFGIVVVNTDPNLPLRLIYNEVAKKAGLSLDEEEYKWLISHIGITPIATIERLCLTHVDITHCLQKRVDGGHYEDIWLSDTSTGSFEDQQITEFKQLLYRLTDETTKRLY